MRAMGANNLISSMQSDRWPVGMPERAAVFALSVLNQGAGKTPETETQVLRPPDVVAVVEAKVFHRLLEH